VYPDVLVGDSYVMGTAVTLTTNQFAQVVGFATGGAVVAFFGTRTSLVIDAATFAVSAIIVRIWVRFRPSPRIHADGTPATRESFLSAVRLIFGNPVLRTSMLFGWLGAFYNAPEGVAAPLARSLGGGAAAVGVILAAQCFGETVGMIMFSRFVRPPTRLRWMGPLAVAACAVLVLFWFSPGLGAALLILAASGACGCYQVAANAAFVRAAPQRLRSQAFGLALGGMSLGQGAVMVIAGAGAQRFAPGSIIGIIGAVGAVCASVIAVSWARTQRARA
jgi:hypothetical protein